MRLALILALCMTGIVAAAQDPACAIPDAVPAVYPAIARAAHVEGDVLFLGGFDHDGKLTGLQLISGPEMLRAASWTSVKTWRAIPFAGSRTCALVVHYRLELLDPPRPPSPSQSGNGHMTITASTPIAQP